MSGIPLRSKAPPPHPRLGQTYEPVAEARTIPLSRVQHRGGSGPTNVQLPGCGHTHREMTISEPNPQRKRLQAWEWCESVRELSLRASRAGLVTTCWNDHPTTRSRPVSEREGHKRSFKNATNTSYMPCSKGRSVSVSALLDGAQLSYWLINPCGGILP